MSDNHATLCVLMNLQRRNLEPCDEFVVIFGGDPVRVGLKQLYLITCSQLSAFNDMESTNAHVTSYISSTFFAEARSLENRKVVSSSTLYVDVAPLYIFGCREGLY